MNDEIKPRPFCGAVPELSENRAYARCSCAQEKQVAPWYRAHAWNTRPIEDGLRARIAELEATKLDYKVAAEKACAGQDRLSARVTELEAALEAAERLAQHVSNFYQDCGLIMSQKCDNDIAAVRAARTLVT